MQYSPKDIDNETKVSLTWHGEDTKVLIAGDGEKTEVKTGDTISVLASQAKELLSYSYLWTLEGDEPQVHGFEQAKKNAIEAEEIKAEQEEINQEVLGAPSAENLSKKEVVSALKKLGVSFNSNKPVAELKELLKEALASQSSKTDKKPEEGAITDQGIAHYVTAEDLVENKELGAEVKEGDLIFLPEVTN